MSSARKPVSNKPGCLVISILCGIAGFVFLVLVTPNCDADSKQARMARSLSHERLKELHQAMSRLWEKIPEEERKFASVHFGRDQIPKEFGGLNAALVRIRDGHSIIRLEGCMDHHLDLIFHGVGEPASYGDQSPRIDLRSGEHDLLKKETLWRPDPKKQESGK